MKDYILPDRKHTDAEIDKRRLRPGERCLEKIEQKPMDDVDAFANQVQLDKQSCDVCGCGEPHAYHEHDAYVANKKMKKEAFDRGFFKAALDNGVNPILAVRLLKTANFDANTAMSALKMGLPEHLTDLMPVALGAEIGALGGAVTGGQHKGRNALIGGALGGLGGAGVGMYQQGADRFNAIKNEMHSNNNSMEKTLKAPEAANTNAHYPFWDRWLGHPVQGEVGQTLSPKLDPEIQRFLEKDKPVHGSSYLQALLGNQNPVSDAVIYSQE